MSTEKYPEKLLYSYGLFSASSYVCSPKNYNDVLQCIDYARQTGYKICPAGSRLSFSNVCLIHQQISLDIRPLSKIVKWDIEQNEITVQAGMLTTELLAFILPQGYTLAGLTGSLGNTISGDISNDVNGKDGWHKGNFGANVVALTIATAQGEIRTIQRQQEPELCNAIISGLGLIAVILEATLKVQKIPSYLLHTRSQKVSNISELIQTMQTLKVGEADMAYCWTEPNARGKNIGRGICETAVYTENTNNYPVDKLLVGLIQKKNIGPFSPEVFWAVMRKIDFPFTYRLAGYAKYFLSANRSKTTPFHQYQYPMLKYFPKWNLKYYPAGFREWQILFPDACFEKAYTEVLLLCQQHKFVPYICAVRKSIRQSPYLSFSGNGFSMTVNYGLNDHPESKRLLFEKELLELLLQFSGKVYLGKVPYFNRATVHKMYPEFAQFLRVKQLVDPGNLFWSDAADNIFNN